MKTQQNDKTIPNKAKSKHAATSPASILVWSFQLKSFRRAVVPTSEDQGLDAASLNGRWSSFERSGFSSNPFDVLSLLLQRIRV